MKKISKKLRILLPFLIVSGAFLLSFIFVVNRDTARFEKLTEKIFQEELAGDTLSMHYILAYPKNYGIDSETACLPSYSKEARQQSNEALKNNLNSLYAIRRSHLNTDSAKTYDMLVSYLEEAQVEQNFPYYGEPLSPSSGIQSQLPILLAEYTFRTPLDVDQYLSLLEMSGPYFDSIIAYEKEKSQAGFFMPDSSADKVIEQCELILDKNALEQGTHFLNTTFEERLQTLLQKGLITPPQKETYSSRNYKLLNQSLRPAYEKLGNSLYLLKGTGKNAEGLAHLPQGREYYSHLFRRITGSSRPMEEQKKILLKQFESDSAALVKLAKEHPEIFTGRSDSALYSEQSFPLKTPENMLTHLCQTMKEDFPAFPAVGDSVPSHKVKRVSENLENYASPAFYLTPPMDDISENSIYINYRTDPQGLELYTTLAHEGYPGHLYQTVYNQLHQQRTESNPVRNLLYYGGYVEGWALYVEMLSYDYAAELAMQNGASEETAYCYEVRKLDRSMQLCLYSLLDIAIHYDGADYGTIHTLLSRFGIDNPDITKNIYEYITDEPATYPKYYIGYLEILSLKERAKLNWGKSYSDKNFHQFMLEVGPCPFDMIKLKNS